MDRQKFNLILPADWLLYILTNLKETETRIHELINEFEKNRIAFIKRLYSLDNHTQKIIAIHLWLKVEMKIVDMAYFTDEHNDHHLASSNELVRVINKS